MLFATLLTYYSVPIRLLIFFGVTAWAYMSPENEYLHNSLVFCYGFMEIVLNFLTYVVVKEERNDVLATEIRARVQ